MNLPEQRTPGRLAVKLKPAAERMARKGHPWVFDKGIARQKAAGEAGDLVTVFDRKSDKFLASGLYDPDSPIRIKLLQFRHYAAIDAAYFAAKVARARHLRQPLVSATTNGYRLLHGENDGLPGLIADVYADVLVLKLYSAIWLPYLRQLAPVLLEASGSATLVLRLSRSLDQRQNKGGLKDGQVLVGGTENEQVVFKEHGLRFAANVIRGHKTGYFLDQRHNRRKIGAAAKGKTVLDVFAYAGGFSVHALAGGAAAVTSIDSSAQALKAATHNGTLNPHKGAHHTICGDAFAHMQLLGRQRRTFDIVVVDPPSFAKRASEANKARKQYRRLATLGAQLVRPRGLLLLASCSSRINAEAFFGLCEEGLGEAKARFLLQEKTFHDVDHPIGFPEGAYLKAGYWRRQS